MDAIEGYLSQQIGSLGVPLTYVIREDKDVDNTVIYGPDKVFEEIVARCRHTGVPFQTDNARVWTAIRHVFFATDGQAWVEEHQARQDGRGAWLPESSTQKKGKPSYVPVTTTVNLLNTRSKASSICINAAT
jgi:hypothetical protein